MDSEKPIVRDRDVQGGYFDFLFDRPTDKENPA